MQPHQAGNQTCPLRFSLWQSNYDRVNAIVANYWSLRTQILLLFSPIVLKLIGHHQDSYIPQTSLTFAVIAESLRSEDQDHLAG